MNSTVTDNQKLSSIFDTFNSDMLFAIVLGFLGLFLFVKVLKWSLQYISIKIPMYRLQILQIETISSHMTYIFGTFWILYVSIKPSKEMLYAFLGSAAVALGFALKDLTTSIVAGIILIFDKPFQVGDRISFRDSYGDIVQIGLRSVRIQTLEDNLVTIPNNLFLSENVASANSGQRDMMVCSDYFFNNNADIAHIIDLLEEVTNTSRFTYLKKPVKVTITTEKYEQAVGLRATVKAYVLETKYEKDFITDITKRFYEALATENLSHQLFSKSE